MVRNDVRRVLFMVWSVGTFLFCETRLRTKSRNYRYKGNQIYAKSSWQAQFLLLYAHLVNIYYFVYCVTITKVKNATNNIS